VAGTDDLSAARAECLRRILESNSPRQVIAAGAGTGKTYTFKELLKAKSGDGLAITLLNVLAKDMADELRSLADTRTFHSLARMLLHKAPSEGISADFHFFPKLEQVIVLDALALGNADAATKQYFSGAFRALILDDGRVEFFLERASFYNAVGFDDSVYRVLERFRTNQETIPKYDQVVVDEYQDFNPLEVEFIDHLESSSPIMIVGDDDQAIYGFKAASPDYLRQKVADSSFEKHDLPFCSRCTSVIVDACNGFIGKAVENGHLEGRIDKEYHCYIPDKEADSDRYPKLIEVRCSVQVKKAPYIAKYIEGVLSSIGNDEKDAALSGRYPLALIIGPSHYLKQIYEYLVERVENVVYRQRAEFTINALDGYRILLKDEKSNLGWRIITSIECASLSDDLVITANERKTELYDELAPGCRHEHEARLQVLRDLINRDELDPPKIQDIEAYFGSPIEQIANELGVDLEEKEDDPDESTKAGADQPEIWLTTYNGCKGMSTGFAFVVGLENRVLPRDKGNVTDTEVCQFVVALTRTRKECHLISTGRFGGIPCERSIFFSWIPSACLERITVNKDYFS